MDSFPAGRGYLAACTAGLPIAGTLAAQRDDLDAWSRAGRRPPRYGALVEEGRALFARAGRRPGGARRDRLADLGDGRGRRRRRCPTAPRWSCPTATSARSSSRSCPGAPRRARAERPARRARRSRRARHRARRLVGGAVRDRRGRRPRRRSSPRPDAVGALTLCDLTQAAGVLPVDAAPFDVTVTHAYKWLCAPRGVAFMTLSDTALGRLRPVQAGWYAGDYVWSSCYGPAMQLAHDARRFDVSPAWQAWPGAVAALEHVGRARPRAAWRHATGLGDRLCDALGSPGSSTQAIVTLADADGRGPAGAHRRGPHRLGPGRSAARRLPPLERRVRRDRRRGRARRGGAGHVGAVRVDGGLGRASRRQDRRVLDRRPSTQLGDLWSTPWHSPTVSIPSSPWPSAAASSSSRARSTADRGRRGTTGPSASSSRRTSSASGGRPLCSGRDDMVGLDSAVILPRKVWEASGHVAIFTDPLVESLHCHKRFRDDHLLEAFEAKKGRPPESGMAEIARPNCGTRGEWTEPQNSPACSRPSSARSTTSRAWPSSAPRRRRASSSTSRNVVRQRA